MAYSQRTGSHDARWSTGPENWKKEEGLVQIMPSGFHQQDEEHLGGLHDNLGKHAVIRHLEDMKGKMILALILVRLSNEAGAAAAAAALGKMLSYTESLTP